MRDDNQVHPSSLEAAVTGYEILEAIYLSALENRRVDFPLSVPELHDALKRQKEELPDVSYRFLP